MSGPPVANSAAFGSENNPGVYYEAGLAEGQKIEVIYCCRDGQETHFDVTGINRVIYKNSKELQERLENRIVRTMGEGPHKNKESV